MSVVYNTIVGPIVFSFLPFLFKFSHLELSQEPLTMPQQVISESLMSGPQFAHLQTWSRKPNKACQSIDHVIAEATRHPEFSMHVKSPVPPRILLGNPATFATDHIAHVAARSTTVIMANGSKKGRAIRTDRHTMAAVVMSYPVPHSAIITDEAKAKLFAWEKRNLEWLHKTYGDQLRVVLAHDDETQPHLHAWLLPDDPGADATTLHPGKVAKKEVEFRAKAGGVGNREAVKLGNRALKAAMTVWQDEYHAAVGIPEGLTRSGPKRRRLSREQWQAVKATAKAHKIALERAEWAQVQADEADLRVITINAHVVSIEAREKEILEKSGTLQKVHASMIRCEEQLMAREDAVSAREKVAEVEKGKSQTAADQIIKMALVRAQEVSDQAMREMVNTQTECKALKEQVHEDRRKIIWFMKMVRNVVVRIGSKMGLDFIGKDLMADMEDIEGALASVEELHPDTDEDSPGF